MLLFYSKIIIYTIFYSFYIYIPCKQKVRCDATYCMRNSCWNAPFKTRLHKMGDLKVHILQNVSFS